MAHRPEAAAPTEPRVAVSVKRRAARVVIGLAALLGGTAVLFLALFVALAWPSHDEVAREPGPGQLDAVVVEGNGGATTSFWYEVYVVPRGGKTSWRRKVADLYDAGRNDSAFGVNVRWLDAGHLVIEYLTAQQAKLVRPSIDVNGQQVQIVLNGGVRDPSAPAGGMLYNLKNRT